MSPRGLRTRSSLGHVLHPHGLTLQQVIVAIRSCRQLVSACLSRTITGRGGRRCRTTISIHADLRRLSCNNSLRSMVSRRSSLNRTLGSTKTTPIVTLMGGVLIGTLRRKISSVRMRPRRRFLQIHFQGSNILQRTLPHVPGGVVPSIATHFGVVTRLSVTRHHTPRSNQVHQIFRKHGMSFQIGALPDHYNRGIMLQVLSGSSARLNLSGLVASPASLGVIRRVTSQPFKLLLMAKPAKSNGAAALCSMLTRHGSPNVGVDATRSPVRCALRNLARMRIVQRGNVSFTSVLQTFLHRSPSMVLINRAHSQRATGATVRTTLAKRLILAALRAGSTTKTITHLSRVKIRSFVISDTLVNMLTRHLIEQIYNRYHVPCRPASSRLTRFNLDTDLRSSIAFCGTGALSMRRVGRTQTGGALYPTYRNKNCGKQIKICRILQIARHVRGLVSRNTPARLVGRTTIRRKVRALLTCDLRLIHRNRAALSRIRQIAFASAKLRTRLGTGHGTSLAYTNYSTRLRRR